MLLLKRVHKHVACCADCADILQACARYNLNCITLGMCLSLNRINQPLFWWKSLSQNQFRIVLIKEQARNLSNLFSSLAIRALRCGQDGHENSVPEHPGP